MQKLFTAIGIALSLCFSVTAQSSCFLVKDGDKVLIEEGDCHAQHSPCSSFKIALSAMGYDSGVLVDEKTPQLPYNEKYNESREEARKPHNPASWMKVSVVWYSQALTTKMGMDKFKQYVTEFNYGNQDISGDKDKNNGLTNAWLMSSLKISAFEQVAFLKKLVYSTLPVSAKALELTCKITYLEDLPKGWKLHGKTGSGNLINLDGSINDELKQGWFIGWMHKDSRNIFFAYYLKDQKPEIGYGGLRAKALAKERLIQLIETL